MDKPWFDPQTSTLLLDEYVFERNSFKKILEDSIVTPEEVVAQAKQVIDLLEKLEQMLSPEAKAVATEALCELAVLYAISRKTV
jgi:hypothetical protein